MPDQTPEPLTDDELREINETRGGLVLTELVEAVARELLAACARIATLQLRLEPLDSPRFEALLKELGIDMTEPMEVLVEKVVQQRGHITELSAEIETWKGMYRVATERADRCGTQVVAAQSEPVGYAVVRGDTLHEDVQLVDDRVFPDLEIAGDRADSAGGRLFELREVRDA